jgi:diphosphomevalonate decarboxylase
MAERRTARAEACANIALSKYWGKSARGDNLTAVPSLSLTLDGMRTRTEVTFDPHQAQDAVWLNGSALGSDEARRVIDLLDRLRARAGVSERATVTSRNDFPTAAGLASSASGFAALAVAASLALGLELPDAEVSAEARRSSASAARSVFGGFVELDAEAGSAVQLAPPAHWGVSMLVAIVDSAKKPIGSTQGMLHTQRTSPLYGGWLEAAPKIHGEVRSGVLERDFERVAQAMEHGARLMHATMMTSQPAVLYLRGPTVELMHEISDRRSKGSPEAYTMDAGPNVKVLTEDAHVARTERFLREFPGVLGVLVCRPGPRASRLSPDGDLEQALRQEPV